jgi:hypothetical protein
MRQLYSTQLAVATGIIIVILTAVFALIQSPEMLKFPETTAVTAAMAVPHPVEGMDICDSCHGIKGTRPYPLKHIGWNNKSCTKCHIPHGVAVSGDGDTADN